MSRSDSSSARRALVTVALFGLWLSGCSSPAAPTPTPPPPPPVEVVADPPTITCPTTVQASTILTSGTAVTFEPTTEKGKDPVSIQCSPASGTNFPIGDTSVECRVTDALNRSAACSLIVQVKKLPTLSKTRFLAFGDSITAGEVTFPVGSTALGVPSFKLVQVPSAAYPTVLAKQLQANYKAQEDLITVANYGVGGEKAADARNRFITALSIVRPEAVLILQGANDIPLGEDAAASTAANEVRIMAAEAKGRGMRVFIATLPPARAGGSRAIKQLLLDDYNNRIRDLAFRENAVLVDIYQYLLSNVTLYIGVDGLHPTEAGYAKMAEAFFFAIRQNLEVP
ncbi:MAG: GDSL-type esterase/lipase family protein [Vicinamibacterales bacterium]